MQLGSKNLKLFTLMALCTYCIEKLVLHISIWLDKVNGISFIRLMHKDCRAAYLIYAIYLVQYIFLCIKHLPEAKRTQRRALFLPQSILFQYEYSKVDKSTSLTSLIKISTLKSKLFARVPGSINS